MTIRSTARVKSFPQNAQICCPVTGRNPAGGPFAGSAFRNGFRAKKLASISARESRPGRREKMENPFNRLTQKRALARCLETGRRRGESTARFSAFGRNVRARARGQFHTPKTALRLPRGEMFAHARESVPSHPRNSAPEPARPSGFSQEFHSV